MNLIKDFENIVEDRLFNAQELAKLSPNTFAGLFDLQTNINDMKRLPEHDKDLVKMILAKMTYVNCCRAVLNMKVHFNKIKDGKNPERSYIQARGAVPFNKGKRKWVGLYLGSEKDVYDQSGKIRPEHQKRGDAQVRNKVLELLREEFKV